MIRVAFTSEGFSEVATKRWPNIFQQLNIIRKTNKVFKKRFTKGGGKKATIWSKKIEYLSIKKNFTKYRKIKLLHK